MLLELNIQNFVLIESLKLCLEPGFNVITGETGAGKSILIGALNLVLGRRASAAVVRPGSAEAVVEALFDISAHPTLIRRLGEAGIDSDGELVVRRVVQTSGRSRAYLNGRLTTVAELSRCAYELADVTSQHESVALADPSRHIDTLDRYSDILEERQVLGEHFDNLTKLARELQQLAQERKERQDRQAYLEYQLGTIDALEPQPGELSNLEASRNRLKHASHLQDICSDVVTRLEQDQEGVIDRLGRGVAELRRASELDPDLNALAASLDECWNTVGEVSRELQRYVRTVEADPSQLEDVQERLFQLDTLLKRFGPTIDDLLDAQRRMQGELDDLANFAPRLKTLSARRDKLLRTVRTHARALSKVRRSAAERLGHAISERLADLGMGRARVVVDVADSPPDAGGLAVDGVRLGRKGMDRVQFLIAPNRGVEPRPLGKIASGGELSRALLALKRALVDAPGNHRECGIQVFDEVDSGVGGAAADSIGRVIAQLAGGRQVLCITHLANIAAYADTHFVVHKHDRKRATTSEIVQVSGVARAKEIARMIVGDDGNVAGVKTAESMLQLAQAAREKDAQPGRRKSPARRLRPSPKPKAQQKGAA